MRRRFELNGKTVQTETRQCGVNCWELRITDAQGQITVEYFDNPKLLDEAVSRTHRDWADFAWVSQPFEDWVPKNLPQSK